MKRVSIKVKRQPFIQIGVYDDKREGTLYLDFNMIEGDRYWGCVICGADDELDYTRIQSWVEDSMLIKGLKLGGVNYRAIVQRDDEYYTVTLIEKEITQ